jgi:hypothetical protein
VANAAKLGGKPASSYVTGGGGEVSLRVVTGTTHAPFTLFTLQDGGTVTAACAAGSPDTTFDNTTGATQPLSIETITPGSPAGVSMAGPPSGNGSVFEDEGDVAWNLIDSSSSGPVRTASLHLMALATGSGCLWAVTGYSSLTLTH